MSTVQQTVREWALAEVVEDRRIRLALGIVAFVVATSFGAYVAVPVPWTPVPMTLQPLFVVLAGMLLGPRAGAAAMASYLAVGAAGFPVFSSGHGGIAWLLGPTGGYLVAYPAAAFLAGWISGGRGAGTARIFLGALAGLLTLYVGGISQLAVLTGEDLSTLLALGVVPFFLGDLLKILIATVVIRTVRHESLGR